MKVKLNDIVNCGESLEYLRSLDLSARLSYRISKLILAVEQEYSIIQQERGKIVEKYGERDKEGNLIARKPNQYSIAPEHIEEANKEINELMNTEIEITISPIKVEELEAYIIAPKYMIGLMPFIEE